MANEDAHVNAPLGDTEIEGGGLSNRQTGGLRSRPTAEDRRYERAVTTLRNHALGKTEHIYLGLCPDHRTERNVTSRDPRCRVCKAIDAVREARRGR